MYYITMTCIYAFFFFFSTFCALALAKRWLPANLSHFTIARILKPLKQPTFHF